MFVSHTAQRALRLRQALQQVRHRSLRELLRPLLRLILIALALGLLLVIALPQLGYPLWFDQGAFAACADTLQRGGVMYRDCWDVRGPLTVFAYALPRLISATPTAVLAFDLLCAAITALLIGGLTNDLFERTRWSSIPTEAEGAQITRRWGLRGMVPGIVAGALYWLMYATLNYWSVAQAEGFANALLVAAVWLTWRAIHAANPGGRRTTIQFLLAGFCCGMAFWSKYPFGLLAVLMLVFIASYVARPLRSIAVFGAGCSAAVLLGLGYFALNGALGALQTHLMYAWTTFHSVPLMMRWRWLTQLFWPEVVVFSQEGSTPTAGFKDTVPQVELLGRGYPFVLVLAIIGAASMLLRPRSLRPNGRANVFALLYLAGTLLITIWEGHFYRYHFIIVLPALAILAGGAFVYGRHRTTSPQHYQARWPSYFPLTPILSALAIIGFVATMLPWFQDAYTNFVLQHKSSRQMYLESEQANDVTLAEFLQANTQPNEPVLIFSDTPAVYALAHRASATRFVYFRWLDEAGSAEVRRTLADQFMQEWQAHRPRYFVLTKDGFPYAEARFGETLKRLPEAQRYFQDHYRYATDIGSYVVFQWAQ